MRILIDFVPILLFFGAYKLHDIYLATMVLMAATVVQTAVMYAIDRKVTTMQKITLALILVFGALTLWLHDERFIKWKPTVLYGAIAIALAVTVWTFKKSFLKLMLGAQIELPDRVWMRLNMAWIVYCLLMAAVNGYVAAYFSTEAWVNFKIWGYVFPLAFLVGQGFYIAPYLKSDEPKADVEVMAPTATAIEQRLRQRLAPSELRVLDESADHAGHAGANGTGFGTHFRVSIGSPLFAGKTRVQSHRLVYDALRDFIDQGLHALAIEVL